MRGREVKDTDVQDWLNELARYIDSSLNRIATEIGRVPSLPSSQFSSYTLNGNLKKRESFIVGLTKTFKETFEDYIEKFNRGYKLQFDVYSAMEKVNTEISKEILKKYVDAREVYNITIKFLSKFPKVSNGSAYDFTLLPFNDKYEIWYGGFLAYVGSKIDELRGYVSADMYLDVVDFIRNEVKGLENVFEISKFDEVYKKIKPFEEIITSVSGNKEVYRKFNLYVRQIFREYIEMNLIEDLDALITNPSELKEEIDLISAYISESRKYDIYEIANLEDVLTSTLEKFSSKVDEKIAELPFEVNLDNYDSYVTLFRKLSELVGEDFESNFESYSNLLGNDLVNKDVIKKIVIYNLFNKFPYFYSIVDKLYTHFNDFADDMSFGEESPFWRFVELYKKVEDILMSEKNEIAEYYLNILRSEVEYKINNTLKEFSKYVAPGVTLDSKTPYDFEVERLKSKFSGVCNEGLETVILAIKSIDLLDENKREVILSILGYEKYELEFRDITVYPPATQVKKLVDAAKTAVQKLIKRYEEKGLDVELIRDYANNFVKTVTYLVNNEFNEIGVPFMFRSTMAQNLYYELVEGKKVPLDSLDHHDRSLLEGILCVIDGCDINKLDELAKTAAYTYMYYSGNKQLSEHKFEAFYYIFKNFDELTPQYKDRIVDYFTALMNPKSREELIELISEIDTNLTNISEEWSKELPDVAINIIYKLSVEAVKRGMYELADERSKEFLSLISA